MNGTLLSVVIDGIRSRKDGSVAITLETQELSPSKAGELFELRNKIAAVYISRKDVIDQKEMNQVDQLEIDVLGKSRCQRQRSLV